MGNHFHLSGDGGCLGHECHRYLWVQVIEGLNVRGADDTTEVERASLSPVLEVVLAMMLTEVIGDLVPRVLEFLPILDHLLGHSLVHIDHRLEVLNRVVPRVLVCL